MERLLRPTIFAHFVAGESEKTIQPAVDRLHAQGVGAILDYAAEADVDETGQSAETALSLSSEGLSLSSEAVPNEPARVYEYESEAQCDANLQIFLEGVRAVHNVTPDGFAAIKVTALGDPALLERVASAVLAVRGFWEDLARTSGGERLTRTAFVSSWLDAFDVPEEEAAAAFLQYDAEMVGEIDVVDFTSRFALEDVPKLVGACRAAGPLKASALSEREIRALRNMMDRLGAVVSRPRIAPRPAARPVDPAQPHGTPPHSTPPHPTPPHSTPPPPHTPATPPLRRPPSPPISTCA